MLIRPADCLHMVLDLYAKKLTSSCLESSSDRLSTLIWCLVRVQLKGCVKICIKGLILGSNLDYIYILIGLQFKLWSDIER